MELPNFDIKNKIVHDKEMEDFMNEAEKIRDTIFNCFRIHG